MSEQQATPSAGAMKLANSICAILTPYDFSKKDMVARIIDDTCSIDCEMHCTEILDTLKGFVESYDKCGEVELSYGIAKELIAKIEASHE